MQQAIGEIGDQISIAHYDMRYCKPLDTEILDFVGSHFKKIVTVEDGSRMGGFGSAILEYFAAKNMHPQIQILGLPDSFVEHGPVDALYHEVGLDIESIKKAIL